MGHDRRPCRQKLSAFEHSLDGQREGDAGSSFGPNFDRTPLPRRLATDESHQEISRFGILMGSQDFRTRKELLFS